MNKPLLFLLSACMACLTAGAQTVFTYGPYKVDQKEFLWAYEKNNPAGPATHPGPKRDSALRSYLDLYIGYKLKVQAAIQGDAVRVTGAKRDDLQAAMALIKKDVPDMPLSFNNFRD